jgi:hypothetical protein
MMPTEASNLENLLERVVQMNMVIIQNMTQQHQASEQQIELLSRSTPQSSITAPEASFDPSSRLLNKINVKPTKYNGTNNENVVTWLLSLEEIIGNRSLHDDEKISLAVSLLRSTALQWFDNLKIKHQRPSSWDVFQEKLISQFQPVDFQEHLRQQLLQLRQKHLVQDYIQSFRSIVGQIHHMDE